MRDLAELAETLKRHDAEFDQSFQDLYERTRRIALAVVRRYNRNTSEYEDILQETYIRVYRSIDSLQDDTKVQAWINRIAANIAIRHNQKEYPMMFSELENEDGKLPELEDDSAENNPELVADRKAVTEIVSQILDELPPDQRAALWMVYGQKVTIREMAEELEVSENTIKSRLYQGRRKMMTRKDDFRKLGIELTGVTIVAVISMSFEETVYAAALAAGTVAGAAGIAANAAATGAGAAANTAVTGVGAAGATSNAAVTGAGAVNTIAATAGTASGAAAGSTAATAGAAVAAAGKTALGIKAVLIGAGAIAAVGGTAVAVHNHKTEPVEVEQTVETTEAPVVESAVDLPEETQPEIPEKDEYGMLPAEAYDNEENREAAEAYYEVLTTDPLFTSDAEIAGICMVDIDQDGLMELAANVMEIYQSTLCVLSYGSGQVQMDQMSNYQASSYSLVPDEQLLIISDIDSEGTAGIVYSFDGEKAEYQEDIYCLRFGSPGQVYVEDPEEAKRQEKRGLELMKKAVFLSPLPYEEAIADVENLYVPSRPQKLTLFEESMLTPEEQMSIEYHGGMMVGDGFNINNEYRPNLLRPYIPEIDDAATGSGV